MEFSRLSELERDVRDKRDRYRRSREALIGRIHEKARPWSLVREHPKATLGLLLSFLSGAKVLLKLSHAGEAKKSHWMWKAAKMSWMFPPARKAAFGIVKATVSAMVAAVRSFLRSFLKK